MVLRDIYGSGITENNTRVEASRFSIKAEGFVRLPDGSENTATKIGSIFSTADPESLSLSLSCNIDIRTAGIWNISIVESGAAVVTHFDGSPFKLEVHPGVTEPENCRGSSESPGIITSGDSWEFTVQAFDKFNNPTSHSSDQFELWFKGREKGTEATEEALKRRTPTSPVLCISSSHNIIFLFPPRRCFRLPPRIGSLLVRLQKCGPPSWKSSISCGALE